MKQIYKVALIPSNYGKCEEASKNYYYGVKVLKEFKKFATAKKYLESRCKMYLKSKYNYMIINKMLFNGKRYDWLETYYELSLQK